MTFGAFIREKRKEHGIGLRDMATRLGLSPSYLMDLEKDRRVPFPEIDRLQRLAEVLTLEQEECDTLYNLVGLGRGEFPPDLAEYIIENPSILDEIRMSKRKSEQQK